MSHAISGDGNTKRLSTLEPPKLYIFLEKKKFGIYISLNDMLGSYKQMYSSSLRSVFIIQSLIKCNAVISTIQNRSRLFTPMTMNPYFLMKFINKCTAK